MSQLSMGCYEHLELNGEFKIVETIKKQSKKNMHELRWISDLTNIQDSHMMLHCRNLEGTRQWITKGEKSTVNATNDGKDLSKNKTGCVYGGMTGVATAQQLQKAREAYGLKSIKR
jgi:hypothetical protein